MRFFTKYTYYAFVFFAGIHFFLYFLLYQMDAMFFYLNKDKFIVIDSLIVDEIVYEESWRNSNPVTFAKRGIVEYKMNSEYYKGEVFLDFKEKIGETVKIAIKKSDYSKVQRCEFLLLGDRKVIGMACLYSVVIICGTIYYNRKSKATNNIIQITTNVEQKNNY